MIQRYNIAASDVVFTLEGQVCDMKANEWKKKKNKKTFHGLLIPHHMCLHGIFDFMLVVTYFMSEVNCNRLSAFF